MRALQPHDFLVAALGIGDSERHTLDCLALQYRLCNASSSAKEDIADTVLFLRLRSTVTHT